MLLWKSEPFDMKNETSPSLSVSCLILLDSESLFVEPRVPVSALLTESKVANISLEMECTNINFLTILTTGFQHNRGSTELLWCFQI